MRNTNRLLSDTSKPGSFDSGRCAPHAPDDRILRLRSAARRRLRTNGLDAHGPFHAGDRLPAQPDRVVLHEAHFDPPVAAHAATLARGVARPGEQPLADARARPRSRYHCRIPGLPARLRPERTSGPRFAQRAPAGVRPNTVTPATPRGVSAAIRARSGCSRSTTRGIGRTAT